MDQLRELIADHIPRLRRYARVLAGNRDRADDLVQDTLERAWAQRGRWRPDSDLRAWLFTIMHNLFVNQWRSLLRRRGDVVFDDDLPGDVGGAEEALALRDLARALERLPADQREVLLLVGLEQLRYEDVAQVLGLPLGTVMSRLARAREHLRDLLAGEVPRLRRVK
jgi:RNA polymerase sigma-70 factor (ECF subfamily)